jgi:hypothetical protein
MKKKGQRPAGGSQCERRLSNKLQLSTVYIPRAKRKIWDDAKNKTRAEGLSLSKLILELLERYLSER